MAGGDVTSKSDIYSLGLVLAEAARGRALDMSGSQAEVIDKRRVVPDLSDVDPAIRPLIQAMLQPLPENRPDEHGGRGRVDPTNASSPCRATAHRPRPHACRAQGRGASGAVVQRADRRHRRRRHRACEPRRRRLRLQGRFPAGDARSRRSRRREQAFRRSAPAAAACVDPPQPRAGRPAEGGKAAPARLVPRAAGGSVARDPAQPETAQTPRRLRSATEQAPSQATAEANPPTSPPSPQATPRRRQPSPSEPDTSPRARQTALDLPAATVGAPIEPNCPRSPTPAARA